MGLKFFAVFLAAFIFILGQATILVAGDEINNGGGLAEKNITYAYVNLENHVKFCLHSTECQLSASERDLLQKIHQSLPQEYENKVQLRFVSEKKTPAFFLIDGQVRLAKTGDKVGDPIYFNTDLIYEDGRSVDAIQKPISIASATATLIHELGHHQQVTDHVMLDLLGQKVSFIFQNAISSSSPTPRSKYINLWTFNSPIKVKDAFTSILLYVGPDVVDLSPMLRESLRCVEGSTDQTPTGATLFNIYWDNIIKERNITTLTIKGNLDVMCRGLPFIYKFYRDNRLEIQFLIRNNGRDASRLIKESIAIRQIMPMAKTDGVSLR